MLILTRKKGTKIVIDGNIEVMFFGPAEGYSGISDNTQYRIGIKAPKHMIVDREEIHKLRVKEKLDNQD